MVEDDQSFVHALRAAFAACGALTVGPCAADDALHVIETGPELDAAVLDINLGDEAAFPLAEELTRRHIPFVFCAESGREGAILLSDTDHILGSLAQRMMAIAHRRAHHKHNKAWANRFMAQLPLEERAFLAAASQPVELKPREVLLEESQPTLHVWFPETAVISLMVGARDVRPIEVGMVGPEGFSDFVPQGFDVSYLRAVTLIGGHALRISTDDFRSIAQRRPVIAAAISRFKDAMSIQFAYSALSHGTATIDARVARWILMLSDRLESDTIPVVHNVIADMLAVRRSGVTTALHILEGMGAIRSVRGLIILRDREHLRRLAGGTYVPPFGTPSA